MILILTMMPTAMVKTSFNFKSNILYDVANIISVRHFFITYSIADF